MTALTGFELKMIYFGLVALALFGIIGSLYASDPIPVQTYSGSSDIDTAKATTEESWINSMFNVLPAPLNDPMCAVVVAVFITPVSIMLGYIAIRAVKDLITQWI